MTSSDLVNISISIAPSTLRFLRDNPVDLFEALSRDPSLAGQLRRGTSADAKDHPLGENGSRAEPLVILASAALIAVIGAAIERVMRVVLRDPVILTAQSLEPKLDVKGKPVTDSTGAPLYVWTTKQTYEEVKQSDPFRFRAGSNAKGFHFEVGPKD